MNLKQLFSIPLYTEENFLSIQECDELLSKILKIETKEHDALPEGKSSFYAGNLLDNLQDDLYLKNKILERCIEFSKQIGTQVREILNSWYNIQELNSELLEHTHPLSTLSCALYINVDENNSALKFTNPNPFIGNQANTHPSPYNFHWWGENVAKGKLIIFPSWLKHSAAKNNQETTKRVVISINAV